MNTSKIEWTDKTWNPVTGCTKISQGCKHCYAETFYERFHGKGSFRNVTCHEDRLRIPFAWKKPSMVFVNSMSDLFHEDVPFSFIKSVLHTIYHAPMHTFQILTKRPERMVQFFKWLDNSDLSANFPNMWLGVSVEDQGAADERIPLLLQVPAAVRFLSCEPLLGPINFAKVPVGKAGFDYTMGDTIHWVIVGGESGHGARPMHPKWARSLRDQCAAAAVPFFFKQWGEYVSVSEVAGPGKHHSFPDGATVRRTGKRAAGRTLDGQTHNAFPSQLQTPNFKLQTH